MSTCLSGGADGSDLLWGDIALQLGHELIHLSFQSHHVNLDKSILTKREHVYEVPNDELLIADDFLRLANKTMRRKFPTMSEFNNNLLRRNYYQVNEADRVYAIAPIKYNIVQGGTGWATQMFIDRKLKETTDSLIECYVFCSMIKKWHVWVYDGFYPTDHVPVPFGCWAGIGSRNITDIEIEAALGVSNLI